ncbi:transglycosylase domain-containing protein [Ferrimonas lipolytica]|uniref:peptidoglycan glycosyltransferase n=1 Tax=Ferrimonas lipolytica TaxID=2724191 RepID=A0A6H1UF16_9GAMM|nr:transglycosylase domain-containing protein [Ferrimonas lipolytica]QIZ76933.1 hypothetical protein HER31_08620 [Ferrimonas lipolytica]
MFSTVRQWISRKWQQRLEAFIEHNEPNSNSTENRGALAQFAYRVNRYGKRGVKVLLALLLLFIAAFMWSNISDPLSLPDNNHDRSKVVVDSSGRPLSVFPNKQGNWRYPIALEDISPLLKDALLHQQDRHFFYHFGVNPFSMIRDGVFGFVNPDYRASGETITVKVAKILYPEAGVWQQTVRAIQLELALTKEEILSLYVNHLPMAPKLEGFQAASYQFFDKPAYELDYSEVALLLAVAKYPKRYRLDKFANRAEKERDSILRIFVDQDFWPKAEVDVALKIVVEPVDLELPNVAPQYALQVKERHPNQTVIQTNIEPVIQEEFERYSREFADKQVNGSSMAMVLMDNKTKQIVAYVGNSPGHDTTDMIQAIRSPGDMLKPLVFAKALDERLIHSESLLADIPRRGYLRDVADGQDEFVGPVSATEALQLSLNLPFIQLIENIGEQKFLRSLEEAEQPIELSDFGLSPRVLLGEAETNLEQMVELYSALGSEGRVASMVYSPDDKAKSKRLFSDEAAWITWDTLKQAALPEYVEARKPEALAWKAGSGWASRDNWSIGATPAFTLGIWVGVHDDIYSSPVSGRADALTALVRISSALEKYRPLGENRRPAGVKQEDICWPDGRSRDMNVYGCDKRKTAWTKNGEAPRTLYAGQRKGWYRSTKGMYVDTVTEKRLSRGCYKNRAEYTTAVLWPRELEPWLPERMRRAERMPAFNVLCPNIPHESSSLKIAGISSEQDFRRIESEPFEPLLVTASGANGEIEWYLNGESIADGAELELNLNRLLNGPQQLIALDDQGYSLQVSFTVSPAG